MKDNAFKLTKERSGRYSAHAITNADYTDDIAILANTPAQAETLLHCLERAAVGIDLHVNAHKTEYMCFNQRGGISTVNGRQTSKCIDLHVNAHKTEYMCFNQRGGISTVNGSPLKLADKFTYLESSVSSTETDIKVQLAKAWTAIDRPSVISKSDLSDKVKHSFFQAAGVSILHYMDAY